MLKELICCLFFRFFNLMAGLHFNDNTNHIPRGQEGWDPLFKLRPFLERLCAAFQVAYAPKQQVTIDEGMCGWRGYLSFRVIRLSHLILT